MQHNRQITIAAGTSRYSAYNNQTIMYSDFIKRLEMPVRTSEIYEAYLQLPKSRQDELKDVGGFVGGQLNGKRRAGNVLGRDLITLDVDKLAAGTTEAVLQRVAALGCASVCYTTRKHSAATPRLRVIFPTDRAVTSEEYEAIGRKMALWLDPTMEMFDQTTFQAERLMYWPSVSADGQYINRVVDSPFLSADGVLATYSDWKDITFYPRCPYETQAVLRSADKQGNPLEKSGVVGAFCRAYTIYDALDKFIPGVYEIADGHDDRLTYLAGSTSAGVVIYGDGTFIYSHHSTDPTSGKLCNAFDMVRLHLYHELDEDAKLDTPVTRMPSYLRLIDELQKDDRIIAQFGTDREASILNDFSGLLPTKGTNENTSEVHGTKRRRKGEVTHPNLNFSVEYDAKGKPKNTIHNAWSILETDPVLKGKVALDVFNGRGIANGAYPWDGNTAERHWNDNDDAGILWYLEAYHDFKGSSAVMSALSLCGNRHSVDPVREYLDKLEWDRTLRLDSLFIDYLGAADNDYTRAVTRKALVAAVARTFEPGCKFDQMTILAGQQGKGKSTILAKLGKGWFSDNLQTFEGKEAQEQIQGFWIMEIGELGYMNKTAANQVKQFLSRTEDSYRAAYGRHTQTKPRRCVFFGTTNEFDYLKDETGNRRFWCIDIGEQEPKYNIFKDLTEDVIDQIWAEAVVRYDAGEELFLSGAEEAIAKAEQEKHRQVDAREGIVLDYINRPIPTVYDDWDESQKRDYENGVMPVAAMDLDLVERPQVCALEIWERAFKSDIKYIKQQDTRQINAIIQKSGDWEVARKTFGKYGQQRGYVRRKNG